MKINLLEFGQRGVVWKLKSYCILIGTTSAYASTMIQLKEKTGNFVNPCSLLIHLIHLKLMLTFLSYIPPTSKGMDNDPCKFNVFAANDS